MKEMKLSELAALLNTSQSNLSNKLKRDNFSEKELQEIAEVLDVELDIRFILKDGTKF